MIAFKGGYRGALKKRVCPSISYDTSTIMD